MVEVVMVGAVMVEVHGEGGDGGGGGDGGDAWWRW